MTEQSILDARLAEIDRRLRNIQSGLDPTGAHVPTPGDLPSPHPEIPVGSASEITYVASPSPDGDDARTMRELLAELREITAAHQRLLTSARELLATFADALARAQPTEHSAAATAVRVSAGPFASTEALRAFERALRHLPEVRNVEVREYTGGDRVVVDVLLSGSIS